MNSLSWERCSDFNEFKKQKKNEPEFLTFGYSCKLFNDNNHANYLNQGKNLVPWMGNDNLLIDRFDVRGYLYLNDLDKYEAKIDVNYKDFLTKEEIELEIKCNKERYKDLIEFEYDSNSKKVKSSFEKEEFLQDEDLKKYNQFQFNYDDLENENKKNCQLNNKDINFGNTINDFVLPESLKVPENILLPKTMKEHDLIEKTAKFISKQGPQMEIILKTKQSLNTQFDFLNYESHLNSYYKFLVKMIKDKKYFPKGLEKEENDLSKDLEEESYLHPSLLNSKNKFQNYSAKYQNEIPNVNSGKTDNSLYSMLAKNLKDKIIVNECFFEPKTIECKSVKYDYENTLGKNKKSISKNLEHIELKEEKKNFSVFNLIPEVPADLKIIIEKLAQYVCKNGDDFEATIKNRNEKRFDFLNPGHKYHFHYVKTKLNLLEKKRSSLKNDKLSIKKQEDLKITNDVLEKSKDKQELTNENQNENNLVLKNTVKSLDNKLEIKENNFETLDEKTRLLKEKQEERKRKAAIFLSKIKIKNESDDPNKQLSTSQNEENQTKIKDSKTDNRESLRNTPSPLREFFDELDFKESKERKQKVILNQMKLIKNDEDPINNHQIAFKKVSKIKTCRLRDRSSSSEKSYHSDKKELKSSSSYESKADSNKTKNYHSSSYHRSKRRSRSRSRRRYSKSRSRSKSRSPRLKNYEKKDKYSYENKKLRHEKKESRLKY